MGGGEFAPSWIICAPLAMYVLHMPTLYGALPTILNRPFCPLLQQFLDETLHNIVYEYDTVVLCLARM